VLELVKGLADEAEMKGVAPAAEAAEVLQLDGVPSSPVLVRLPLEGPGAAPFGAFVRTNGPLLVFEGGRPTAPLADRHHVRLNVV
jgi:hypothetical protein